MKIFARGHNEIRTDGKARGPCVNVPEGKKVHVWPSKQEALFLLHAFIFLIFVILIHDFLEIMTALFLRLFMSNITGDLLFPWWYS